MLAVAEAHGVIQIIHIRVNVAAVQRCNGYNDDLCLIFCTERGKLLNQRSFFCRGEQICIIVQEACIVCRGCGQCHQRTKQQGEE